MEIKFRGKNIHGDYIYSNSIDVEESGGRKNYRLKNEVGVFVYVEAESVEQFVGYDMDGAEIYVGDKLTDSRIEREFEVRVCGGIVVKTWEIGDKLYYYKLKGGGENDNLP